MRCSGRSAITEHITLEPPSAAAALRAWREARLRVECAELVAAAGTGTQADCAVLAEQAAELRQTAWLLMDAEMQRAAALTRRKPPD